MSDQSANDTLAARLRIARNRHGLTQPQLAERVGMSQQAINEIENGRVARPRKLREISRALKVSEEWMLGEAPLEDEASAAAPPATPAPNASFPPTYVPFSGQRVPLLGQAAAGAGPNGRFWLNGQEIAQVFCPPELIGIAGAYAVYVYGDSMEPKFEAGEIVWLHPYLPVRRGDYVVAQIAGDNEADELAGYVKQFVSHTSSRLTLRQFNPQEGEDELLTFDAEKVFSIHKIVFSQLK